MDVTTVNTKVNELKKAMAMFEFFHWQSKDRLKELQMLLSIMRCLPYVAEKNTFLA